MLEYWYIGNIGISDTYTSANFYYYCFNRTTTKLLIVLLEYLYVTLIIYNTQKRIHAILNYKKFDSENCGHN